MGMSGVVDLPATIAQTPVLGGLVSLLIRDRPKIREDCYNTEAYVIILNMNFVLFNKNKSI